MCLLVTLPSGGHAPETKLLPGKGCVAWSH
jgi:hypothetical protein